MANVPSRMWALWRRVTRPFGKRDLLEAVLVAVAFLLYFAVRGAVIDRPQEALDHALDIIDLQRRLGFFWEDDMQEWIKDRLFMVQAANIVYFWLHFPLIIAFGMWLYFRQRHKYTIIRDAFLASGAIALIIYWLYPVAPPRLLPELAQELGRPLAADVASFVDTMREHLGYAYQSQETAAFVNPYAAMPSLHFGWDFLLGVAIIWAFWRRPLMWVMFPIGVALPVMQVMSITTTGNHYFLDSAAGVAVSVMGIPIAVVLSRQVYPRLGQLIERLPWPQIRLWILPQSKKVKASQM